MSQNFVMTKATNRITSDNYYIFENTSHFNSVVTGLQSLRDNDLLNDITLIVGGQRFKGHKAVLASCSDYFKAMFTEPMLESRQHEVTLNGLTARGFKIVIDYIYTGRLILNHNNVQDVLSAATHVQVPSVVYACSNYLQSQIDIENCIDIANIAENYSLTTLKNRVYMYMSTHLLEFACSQEFLRLSPQQLKALLSSDLPVNCSETNILNIVLNWYFNTDWDTRTRQTRLDYFAEILTHVNFGDVSRFDVKVAVAKHFPSRDEYVSYKILINEYHRQRKCKTSPNYGMLLNIRGMELAILKIGGFGRSGMTNEITYCLADQRKWRHLTSIPHVEQCNFGTAVYNNELYVVGGCFNQSLQETIHPFGFKYNPWYNKWSTIAPMKTERCRFSLTLLGNSLYAIGGAVETENDEEGSEVTNICERYVPSTDYWESIHPLKGHRTQHAATAYQRHGNINWIFVTGGIDSDTILSSTCYYDQRHDIWWHCEPMLRPRADHVMITVEHKIFVCGGWTEDPETRARVLMDTIDAYDIARNEWYVVTRVPTPRYHAGIVKVNDKIYFIGGFHNVAAFDRDKAAIECYDIVNDSWTTEDKYPQVIWEHTCATVYVPKRRDDMEVLDL